MALLDTRLPQARPESASPPATNQEIAALLMVSVHTLNRNLQNADCKIGARNRADAVAYVIRGEASGERQP